MNLKANNPIIAARELHSLIGWTNPSDFSMEEIALYTGAVIKKCTMKGAEGRILINGNNAVISINSSLSLQSKVNFIIGHELGHFLLHKNYLNLFSDTNSTLSDWFRNGPQEQEANSFASELLIPSDLFKNKVAGKKLSITLIAEVAEYFRSSLTATLLKYRELGDYPIMIIYIDEGIIKWRQTSDDFPFKYLPLNSKVPDWTVAGDFFNGKGLETKPEIVDAIEWFPSDYKLKNNSDWKLWEQCFQVSSTGLISCLWTA